ncbi:unnamed protein product [Sphagnum balticum]
MILKTDDLLALGDLGIVKVPFVPYVACDKCGAAFIAPEFQPGLEEHIAKQLVVSPNLLTKPQIRFLRVFFGLTQDDIAKQVGATDRHHYQKMESRKSEIHMSELMQLRLKIGYAEMLKITDAKVLYELNRRGMRTRSEIEQRLKELRNEEKALLAELVALDAKREESIFSFPLGTQATKGIPPHATMSGVRGICDKPRVKCSDCPSQAFPGLDDIALRRHLEGHETVGTYAIRTDDSCIFLATDFDGGNYKEETLAFKQAARELGVAAEIERSRSGNGAHVWIFFSEPIPASLARRLGSAVLSRATAIRHTIDLKAFDRFFRRCPLG